jgi:hypothetical protein
MFACYRPLALRSLGDEAAATALPRRLHQFARREMDAAVKIDYFARSLPNFLFEDDLRKRNRIQCLFLRGIVRLALVARRSGATASLGNGPKSSLSPAGIRSLDRRERSSAITLS